MVYGTEMVSILTRNDGELVVRVSGVGIDVRGQVIVTDGRTPFALFIIAEFGFAVPG